MITCIIKINLFVILKQLERGTEDYVDRDDLWIRARMGKDGKYANEETEHVAEKIVSIVFYMNICCIYYYLVHYYIN